MQKKKKRKTRKLHVSMIKRKQNDKKWKREDERKQNRKTVKKG